MYPSWNVSLIVVAAKAFLQTLLGAPRRNKEDLGTYPTWIVGGFAILAYLLRVAARLPGSGSKWGLDDWTLTLAMLFIIPLTICAYVCKFLLLLQPETLLTPVSESDWYGQGYVVCVFRSHYRDPGGAFSRD
jgi:hypothetical protein